MTTLHFQLGAGLRTATDLPVEIRKPNMALVERTLSSEPVELAPGIYFVSTKLPTGQEISHEVEIDEAEESLSVELVQGVEGGASPEALAQEAPFPIVGGVRYWRGRSPTRISEPGGGDSVSDEQFESGRSQSNRVGVTLSQNVEGNAIAGIMEEKEGVEVTRYPATIRIDADNKLEFDLNEIVEAIADVAEFTAYDFQVETATHYGHMVGLDEKVLVFANPEDAAEEFVPRATEEEPILFESWEPERTFEPPMRSGQIEARLRVVAGNVLQGRYEVSGQWPWHLPPAQGKATTRLEVGGRNEPLFAQVLQPDLPPLNIALPAALPGGCLLILTRLPDGHVFADVQIGHDQAELLLRYWENGLLREMEALTRSHTLDAEELLRRKRRDPVAAAVGAYALLRLAELERLHDWTGNLEEWFPWFPDGAAVRGEHLARLGQHEEALAAFLELPGRGLPMFSDGVSYAVNRLELYTRVGEKPGFSQEALSLARDALGRLQEFVPYIDFNRLVTSFVGLDPGRPTGEPLRHFRYVEDGQDVGYLFEYPLGQGMTPEPVAAETYPAGLSAREVEVLRLVATGLTNAEVAGKLFISSRTVNRHLGSIYRKLGFPSRTEATRFAIDHDLL